VWRSCPRQTGGRPVICSLLHHQHRPVMTRVTVTLLDCCVVSPAQSHSSTHHTHARTHARTHTHTLAVLLYYNCKLGVAGPRVGFSANIHICTGIQPESDQLSLGSQHRHYLRTHKLSCSSYHNAVVGDVCSGCRRPRINLTQLTLQPRQRTVGVRL